MTQRSSLVVVRLVKAASNEEAGLERGGDKNRKGGMQQSSGRVGVTSKGGEAVLKQRRGKKKNSWSHTQSRLVERRGGE